MPDDSIRAMEDTYRLRLFLLRHGNEECRREAMRYLQELGARALSAHAGCAVMAEVTRDQAQSAYRSGLFLGTYANGVNEENLSKLSPAQRLVAELWNFRRTEEYRKVARDFSQVGKSWAAEDRDPPWPMAVIDPEDFKRRLAEELEITEEQVLRDARKGKKKPEPLDARGFEQYERELAERLDDPTAAYHLARIAYRLDPAYLPVILKLPSGFAIKVLAEVPCWKLENEISVGIVFVESSQASGPRFSASERATLMARVLDGLQWLSGQAPSAAHLSWVVDWQFVQINVANGNDNSKEPYWRDPAMAQVNYNGITFPAAWESVAKYREAMRQHNRSAHAVVIFVTPYGNEWHAYASFGRVTLAKRNNWGNWGIGLVDEITSHEVSHLFGAADEYTGSGTPCSSCGTQHGCYKLPNGNCGSCARPFQDCIMDANQHRLCAYTQGHLGWADLFLELTTADELYAGTDDTVWLDIGDRTFVLDNPNHDDRERNNVEGYALNYTGVTKSQIKRLGLRKSPDGLAGGWKLRRARLWCRGELICDHNNIDTWLEDDQRWWAASCGATQSDIVNRLVVQITTADVSFAGTDDDVTLFLGGRSWNLDKPWHNDFERGNTDTFVLDPGTGLYQSMIHSVHIHKSPDGVAGGWKLKGVKILVNGATIFNNQSINKWLEDNDRDWFGTV